MNSKVAPVLVTCRCKCACTTSTQQQAQQATQLPQQEHKPNSNQQVDNPQSLLQLQVRSLEKYKRNYELLCSQLGELNAQVGLQLEQHEADVSALTATISGLQESNKALECALNESQRQLVAQRQAVQQGRAYSERVHAQLSTAADLLQATEKRIEGKEHELTAQVNALQAHLLASEIENEALVGQHCLLREELLASQQTATEKLQASAQKLLKLKAKLKRQSQALQSEVDALSSELETQRALARNTKKQFVHEKLENDALAKQLSSVKRDVKSLAAMLEQQKATTTYHEQKHLRARKQAHQAEAAALSSHRQVESLQVELTVAREALVDKNASLEALQNDLRTRRAQCELHECELSQVLTKNEELKAQVAGLERQCEAERRQLEGQERQRVRTYRKELHQMRQLLAVNHQKAVESSRDVESLKQEFFGVQELLHAFHSKRDSWRQYIAHETDETDETDETETEPKTDACAAAKAEESVLKRAIMEQVAAANNSRAPVRVKKGREKK